MEFANYRAHTTEKEFFQLRFAGFFRFMAANLSLIRFETAARPLWCV